MMQKIEAADGQTKSTDLISGNVELIKQLWPDVFSDGHIDFEALKQLLGEFIDEKEEKYGLNWPGKRKARLSALTPSTGTLRPEHSESVDWSATSNIMVEGDNLEVLKLFQKSYHGQVKMIYIDPPYNTGNDFIYPDDYAENLSTYLQYTGQIDAEGRKFSTNTESSGRFHSKWLCMMYPRLFLARNLLKDDGLIFMSIDEHEASNLRMACDEVFGPENYIGALIWKRRKQVDSRTKTGVSMDHEYCMVYRKTDQGTLRGKEIDLTKYKNPNNDPGGPWTSDNLLGLATKEQRPNLHYDLINPSTKINYGCPPTGWRYQPASMSALIEEGRILWPESETGRPRYKRYLNDLGDAFTGLSSVLQTAFSADGTTELKALFDGKEVIDFPKPSEYIKLLILQATEPKEKAIILDFFAGSGTTGQAVMQANKDDGGNRSFILVQLPEPTENIGFNTIAEVTKERLRRFGKKLVEENKLLFVDTGFKVFKLDSSNIHAWEPDRENLQKSLLDAINHLNSGRSEQDILFELLLKLGLNLSVDIEQRTIQGKLLYSIGAGTLMVCLADNILPSEVETLAQSIISWQKELAPTGETSCVFRDSAFTNDIGKTNMTAILEQSGVANIRSI